MLKASWNRHYRLIFEAPHQYGERKERRMDAVPERTYQKITWTLQNATNTNGMSFSSITCRAYKPVSVVAVTYF